LTARKRRRSTASSCAKTQLTNDLDVPPTTAR
jgi:hypothetical protein